MKVEEYQSLWAQALEDNKSVASSAEKLQVQQEKLLLYNEFIQGHRLFSLEKNYPLTLLAYKKEPRAVCTDFFKKYPADSWELNSMVECFENYLAQENAPECIQELAKFEWQQFCTYLDESNESELIKKKTPGNIILNPTVAAHKFKYDISLWVNDISNTSPVELEHILIFNRDKSLKKCHFTKISQIGLHLIHQLIEQETGLSKEELVHNSSVHFDFGPEAIMSELNFLIEQNILLS